MPTTTEPLTTDERERGLTAEDIDKWLDNRARVVSDELNCTRIALAATKAALATERANHQRCDEKRQAFLRDRDDLKAKLAVATAALEGPPTAQEIQMCCLAFGGSSFVGPIRDVLEAFIAMRREALAAVRKETV